MLINLTTEGEVEDYKRRVISTKHFVAAAFRAQCIPSVLHGTYGESNREAIRVRFETQWLSYASDHLCRDAAAIDPRLIDCS